MRCSCDIGVVARAGCGGGGEHPLEARGACGRFDPSSFMKKNRRIIHPVVPQASDSLAESWERMTSSCRLGYWKGGFVIGGEK